MNGRIKEGEKIIAGNHRLDMTLEDMANIINTAADGARSAEDMMYNAARLAYMQGLATGINAGRRQEKRRRAAAAGK